MAISIPEYERITSSFFNDTLTENRYRDEILFPFINQLSEEEITRGYLQEDEDKEHVAGETINKVFITVQ